MERQVFHHLHCADVGTAHGTYAHVQRFYKTAQTTRAATFADMCELSDLPAPNVRNTCSRALLPKRTGILLLARALLSLQLWTLAWTIIWQWERKSRLVFEATAIQPIVIEQH